MIIMNLISVLISLSNMYYVVFSFYIYNHHHQLSSSLSSYLYFKSVRRTDNSIDITMNAKVDIKPREFRNLNPIPSLGIYSPPGSESISSFYLGPEKMICQQRNNDVNSCIVRGIIPVPIPDGFDNALLAAIPSYDDDTSSSSTYRSNWSGQLITDRNGGFYDNLKQVFIWASKPQARRTIYETLRLKSSCLSPYHGIITAIERYADLKICGLLVELADSPSEYTYTLGKL